MTLRNILTQISKELKERSEARENLYGAMRKATYLSKQAIFSVHRGAFQEAETYLKEAEALFGKLSEVPSAHQKLIFAGIVYAAFQEYAEACIFLQLVRDGELTSSAARISVPSTAYLLGLADVIGELRRRVLESLKTGNVDAASENLETMEGIYEELVALDVALHTVSEFRRKLDIARRILEATRGDVTIEMRRDLLKQSLDELGETLKKKKE